MTKRENLLSLIKHQGYSEVPVSFDLCPSLIEEFTIRTGSSRSYAEYFNFPWGSVHQTWAKTIDTDIFRKYYNFELKPGTIIDIWGIAHEPGSAAAKHMTRMLHPLENLENNECIKEYPFPDFDDINLTHLIENVKKLHDKGLAAIGQMQCTIWETSWYLRGMENLMVDMLSESEIAQILMDKVLDAQCKRAENFAKAGVDILFLGDDIGMQSSLLMSEDLYRTWIKPRLKTVIDAAKKINPALIIFYHSCGYITPLINDLIEAGIDVLNPIQPECMDFKEIYAQFGNRLSFHGTIGTQTTMPFGTPDDVRREVFRNLEIAGDTGGLICAPTHLLEPEVPWENIMAFVKACRDFKR